MYPLSGGSRLALAAVAAVTFAGCASMQVNSYEARGVDFAQYRSYAWAPADRLATGDPRLDNNPFFDRRLRSDVERRLAVKGFEKRDLGTPDLEIHYHASVTQQIDVNDADLASGYCEHGECRPVAYEAGTIVVDFVDARTSKLVWRGWAKSSIDGVIDNQEWMEQRIDEAVTRIMERLPDSPLRGRG